MALAVLVFLCFVSSNHLFIHCLVVDKVWSRVMNWLGFNYVTPSNLFVYSACWSEEAKSKKDPSSLLVDLARRYLGDLAGVKGSNFQQVEEIVEERFYLGIGS